MTVLTVHVRRLAGCKSGHWRRCCTRTCLLEPSSARCWCGFRPPACCSTLFGRESRFGACGLRGGVQGAWLCAWLCVAVAACGCGCGCGCVYVWLCVCVCVPT